jgi:hypothetical protein
LSIRLLLDEQKAYTFFHKAYTFERQIIYLAGNNLPGTLSPHRIVNAFAVNLTVTPDQLQNFKNQ